MLGHTAGNAGRDLSGGSENAGRTGIVPIRIRTIAYDQNSAGVARKAHNASNQRADNGSPYRDSVLHLISANRRAAVGELRDLDVFLDPV